MVSMMCVTMSNRFMDQGRLSASFCTKVDSFCVGNILEILTRAFGD